MANLTTKEMNIALAEAHKLVPEGSTWLHYKGGIYVVLGHTICTETSQILIRYRRINGQEFDYFEEQSIEYSRSIVDFLDQIPTPYGCDADGNMIIPPGHIGRFERVRKVEMWKLLSSTDKSIVIR